MPNRQNPCVAAAVQTKAWYQHLNGKTKLVVQTFGFMASVVLATLWFEGRYAKAEDVKPIQESVYSLVAAMTIQQVTRQTVLNLKKANGSITPEESVELAGIEKVLKVLEK